MSRFAYVNGRYVQHKKASVHIEDRGYQFSDGVYEVIAVFNGKLIDFDDHFSRLGRSLNELELKWPIKHKAMIVILKQIIRKNRIIDGIIYLQITRGVAPRQHAFPEHLNSSLVITAKNLDPFEFDAAKKGINIITTPEIRWQRCDIKSISLLGNCLAKEKAKRADCYEAWFVEDDGMVTEGTSSNAWIVSKEGKLITRNISNSILNGITRLSIIKVARENDIEIIERPFSIKEAKSAKEAFISSTTSLVKPVLKIDGNFIGNGKVGKLSTKILDYYGSYLKAQSI